MKKVKAPVESVVLEFDFSSELPGIDTVTVSTAVDGVGTDPDIANFLQGAPQVSGTSVFQRIAGGRRGFKYQVRCVAQRGSDIILRKDVIHVAD